MALHVSAEWLEAYRRRTGLGATVADRQEEKPGKRTKYGNVKEDGFDSRHEKAAYDELRLACAGGVYKGLARQVPFYLPGGVKYIADFVTLNNDGTYTVFDAKSEATRKDKVYRLKRRQMENCLGITIREV